MKRRALAWLVRKLHSERDTPDGNTFPEIYYSFLISGVPCEYRPAGLRPQFQ